MAEVNGAVLKCVLQLAACTDKLKATNAVLSQAVTNANQLLPAAQLPTLKATLTFDPTGTSVEAAQEHTKSRFQALYDHGMEAAEHLEVKKLRLEKELRRRSQDFRDLMSTRNSDIQEEYARMLKELEEQVELLTQQVASEKARKQQFKRRRKRGREDDSEVDAQANAKARDLHHENEQMKHHIEEFTHNIRQLQTSYTALERELNGANAEPSTDPLPAADVAAEEALASEVATLKQEVELLRRTKADAEELAARKASEKSEPNDPAPKDAMEEEATTLRDQLSEISSQLSASSVRLQSLLRSLAPAPSIGSLMTRLHQQLATKDDTQPGKRKTVEMDVFLKSCPSADEGRKAIELMKTLQLIYCYEASGVIALAD